MKLNSLKMCSFITLICFGVAFVITSCNNEKSKEASKLLEQQKERERKIKLSEIANKYNAIAINEDTVSFDMYTVDMYTFELQKLFLHSYTNKNICFSAHIEDIFIKNNEYYLKCESFDLYNFYFDLKSNLNQIQWIIGKKFKKSSRAKKDIQLIFIAKINSVSKPLFTIRAVESSKELDPMLHVDGSPEVFIVEGECIEIISLEEILQ